MKGSEAQPGPAAARSPISRKAGQFTESVIREMTRLAINHQAVNLAQGFPDFAAPEEVKEAAVKAIRADINQYAITWGARDFRQAVADRFRHDVLKATADACATSGGADQTGSGVCKTLYESEGKCQASPGPGGSSGAATVAPAARRHPHRHPG